jgi:hypothetical protein
MYLNNPNKRNSNYPNTCPTIIDPSNNSIGASIFPRSEGGKKRSYFYQVRTHNKWCGSDKVTAHFEKGRARPERRANRANHMQSSFHFPAGDPSRSCNFLACRKICAPHLFFFSSFFFFFIIIIRKNSLGSVWDYDLKSQF